MSEPRMRVSIVLPVYNGEGRVHQAITSCLLQTHCDIELVVVDDCSTDRTPEIVKSFDDPRIVYIRNVRNAGLPGALNIGFARTTGNYLTWTSDDNEYAPTAIAEMLRALRGSPEVDFVYADYTAYFESTGETERRKLPDELALDRTNTVQYRGVSAAGNWRWPDEHGPRRCIRARRCLLACAAHSSR